MNTTEIVIGEMQSDSGPEMFQFLGKTIREPRKSSHRHTHGEVLPFHEAGRNMLRIRIANSDFGYNPLDWRWGIPPFGAVVLSVVAEHFRQLREVYVGTKAFRNAYGVVVKSVGSKLHAVCDALVQVPQESPRIGTHTLADAKRRNQFRFGINRNVNPLIAHFRRIAAAHVPALLADVAPDFINLQIFGLQVLHSRVHKTGAAVSGDDKQTHDCVAIQAYEPFRAANRTAFQKATQRTLCRVGIRNHSIPRQFVVRFAEGARTRIAAPALNAAFTEVPELLADLALTFDAGHGFSPLDFCGEKPHTHFGSGVRLTPRFGLSGTHGSNRGYRVCIYSYGGGMGHFSFRAEGKFNRPTDYLSPFADVPAKSSACAGLNGRVTPVSEKIGEHSEFFQGGFSPIQRSRVAVASCDVASVGHSLQRGSYGCQGISLVLPKVETYVIQVIAHVGNGQEFSRVCRENQLDCILKSRAFGFHIVNSLLIGLLAIFGKQRKDRNDKLLHLCEFYFGLIALPNQLRSALHQVNKHLPVIYRRLCVHNGDNDETKVYTCQGKS